jgi:molybdopterin/thiamine biosynthesis adenylyltransferase
MNIGVIGCGGIGSYFAQHIDRLIELQQIDDNFVFFDDDIVEMKNMLYQNFETGDIDSLKTQALSFRYLNLNFIEKRIELNDLKKFNLVILCADNNKIRKEAYENWIVNGIPFIDARANGKAVGIFSSSTPDYLKTIGLSDAPSSCQNPFQIAKKEIEYGNVVIASILAQVVLSYKRSKKLPADFMISF